MRRRLLIAWRIWRRSECPHWGIPHPTPLTQLQCTKRHKREAWAHLLGRTALADWEIELLLKP